jgi:hypothetical protein
MVEIIVMPYFAEGVSGCLSLWRARMDTLLTAEAKDPFLFFLKPLHLLHKFLHRCPTASFLLAAKYKSLRLDDSLSPLGWRNH